MATSEPEPDPDFTTLERLPSSERPPEEGEDNENCVTTGVSKPPGPDTEAGPDGDHAPAAPEGTS